MPATVAPIRELVMASVQKFIASNLGGQIQVVRGLGNRVPMPKLDAGGFVVMTPINQKRMRTSVDTYDTAALDPTTVSVEEDIELTLQIDFYGKNSQDFANIFTALWRDEQGCIALAPVCQPLYADEAQMMPLIDAEEQYEERWRVDARLQYNPTVTVSQQYASALAIELINVEATYG